MSGDFSLTIHGRRWRVRFVPRMPPDTLGDCDWEAREIRVLRGLTPAETLGVLLHEAMHALHPNHTEEHVSECERVLATMVYRAGLCADDE